MWIADPKTKEKSVTLTLMVFCFAAALIGAGLEMSGLIKTTSIVLEMFWGTLATYLGRRFTFGNKQFDAKE